MKILVSIKRVPDPYAKIRLTPQGALDTVGLNWTMNPFDAIALEEALRIREKGVATEIIVVSIGGPEVEETLRTALAMGADRAICILEERPPDPQRVSQLLAAIYHREQPRLILMGKQATDDDSNQVGQRLAALLQLPQATFASSIHLASDGQTAQVTREVDSGREILELTLPAVITADLRLNEPRYVALPAILKARTKPLLRLSGFELVPLTSPGFLLVKRETPPPRKPGRKVQNVEELIAALREEAKVLPNKTS
ncbi:electron transfer flavoprotein beta subunit [Chthonomonas calidirosea]|uniref:Electron transfer flavoprotein subunit beta n=1 Tax=Chthonomonas calidirosea (strain DSM 23976 / ICMP 18418 / T49) TaxID=1303518 RepID=S0EX90_CHTCT|nr:electron transfer flavoprotein subunit beta/FixA family protein [Chthonomonas calidirosea]CCW34408.1 electron transfer flavoprotein beta subunit [Chthonomonas calidirosea T49]CEK14858.1 electron transfer flavoprotein beta subunit [Chthonomonas calidirosea]